MVTESSNSFDNSKEKGSDSRNSEGGRSRDGGGDRGRSESRGYEGGRSRDGGGDRGRSDSRGSYGGDRGRSDSRGGYGGDRGRSDSRGGYGGDRGRSDSRGGYGSDRGRPRVRSFENDKVEDRKVSRSNDRQNGYNADFMDKKNLEALIERLIDKVIKQKQASIFYNVLSSTNEVEVEEKKAKAILEEVPFASENEGLEKMRESLMAITEDDKKIGKIEVL